MLQIPTLEEIIEIMGDDPDWKKIYNKKFRIEDPPAHNPGLGPCYIPGTGREGTGYAAFKAERDVHGRQKRVMGVHKWVWEKLHGPVPPGFELDHLCHDENWCAPPRPRDCPHRPCFHHVVARKRRDNRLRANNATGINSRKTHCDSQFSPRDPITGEVIGHDWMIPGNVRVVIKGGSPRRSCVPCESLRTLHYKRKQRASA